MTVGAPTIQGAMVTGMQGMGVKTPKAAMVAARTMGLAILVQEAKGLMFTNGLKSMMLAMGPPAPITRLVGRTVKTEGAIPNEH